MKWRLRTLALSVSAFAGVLLVVLAAASTSGAHVSGDLLALSNVCIWTTYFVMAKTPAQRRHSLVVVPCSRVHVVERGGGALGLCSPPTTSAE